MVATSEPTRVSLPVLRGSAEGAECESCPFSYEGRPNRPVFSEYPEDPKWIIIAEGPGFNEVRLGRPLCLVPETLVLMADLTWQPLGNLKIGDRIFAPDVESTKGKGVSGFESRKWRIATITATHRRVAEAIEVRTDHGSLQGSADHPVLIRGSTSYWLEMGKLQAKEPRGGRASKIAFVETPWTQNRSYEAAWLAGFLDGEGHVLGSWPRGHKRKPDGKVGFTQNAGPTFDRAVAMVRALGYDLNVVDKMQRGRQLCYRVTIRSEQLGTTLRFLGEVRPERLVAHFQNAIEGKSIRGLLGAEVLSRKPIGTRELVDITTTSGTFIANGFVVHNCGATGEVVMKLLARIGRKREDVFLGNATLCQPPQGSPDDQRHKAAVACKTRLQLELAQFPGKPILALGAVSTRSILPQAALDAIDPPDVPESKQKRQKRRQRNEAEIAAKRQKKLDKLTGKHLRELLDYRRKQLIDEIKRRYKRKPERAYIERQLDQDRRQLEIRARDEAAKELVQREAEKAAKPKKKKPIKITDIVGTCFDVDVDGTGVRPVIPAIHPAALLRGGGKAQPLTAKVLTPHGFVEIGSLRVGDVISSTRGGEQRVIGVFPQGVKKINRVSMNDGSSTLACDEHLWETHQRKERRVVCTAEIRDSISMPLRSGWREYVHHLPLVGAVEYRRQAIDLPLAPYLLGLLLGDGSYRHGVAFFHKPENDLHVALRRLLPQGDKAVDVNDGRGSLRINGGQKQSRTLEALRLLGLEGKASFERFIPSAYMRASVEERLQLLRGLLDTDGYVKHSGHSVEYSTTSPLLADDIKNLVRSLGGIVSISSKIPTYTHRGQRKIGRRAWRLVISFPNETVPVLSVKHRAKWRSAQVKRYRSIVSVDPAGEAECVCIRVSDESQLYITDDFIVTHNSIAGSHTPDLAYVNLTYDFAKVDALAHGKRVRLDINVEYEGKDAERATWLFVEAIQAAFDEGACSIDLETYVDDPDRHHALMAYMARIAVIGIATNKRSISVVYSLIAPWALSYFQALLASKVKRVITHNGLYDRTVLRACGYEVEDANYLDTLYAHHSAFPGCAHGLQIVTSQFFATSPWKSEFRNAAEDQEKLLVYNAKDTGATHALHPTLQILVRKNGNEQTYDIDRKMAECASRMHLRGMPVSREVNTELLTTFTKNVAESRDAVEAVARDPANREQIWHYLAFEQAKTRRKADLADFNTRYESRLSKIKEDVDKNKWRWKISGSKHVAALIQALGVQLQQVTASGNVSTKKEVLEGLVHVPFVRDLLTYRENDKLLSTFIWQIFDRHDINGNIIQSGYADENDRIHPIWNIHKISGRWASYEPVVSNVPKAKFKKQPDGTMKMIRPNLRRQIQARKGRKLVLFDFAQLEARNLALISGDLFLLDVFATGKDIHTECARVVFSGAGGTTPFDQLDPVAAVKAGEIEIITPCEVCGSVDFHIVGKKCAKMKKQLRDLTKNVEYGAFYGGSPETLWKLLLKEGFNVKLADVTAAINALMRKMPGIVRWQREAVAKASLPPYTVKDFIMGRRRVFPMGQVDPNEALNFESQATAAAIMNTGMYRMEQRIIDRGYKECFSIVQVHDAAAYECDEDDAEDVGADIEDCYTQEYSRNGLTIPYPVEVKICDSWDGL